MEIEEKKYPDKEWVGTYREIHFEINRITSEIGSSWFTYYIWLNIDKIPEKHDPDSFLLEPEFMQVKEGLPVRCKFDEYSHPVIGEIYFHGGITYYKRQMYSTRQIKMGCDYNHYNDDGGYLEGVKEDVIRTIDSVYELMPGYGTWNDLEETMHDRYSHLT